MVITLDSAELLVCYVLATMRNNVARRNGVKDQKMDKKEDPIEIDRIGLMAEIAWAKWRNTYPDLTASPRSGTHDAVFRGKTIDIKATKHKDGRLVATLKKTEADADIYVLAIITGRDVDFVGYKEAKDLLREENIGDLGCGPGYMLEQSQLWRFKS